ncbi:MAG TPA: CBS domain-containing protein, partial [Bacillota bacterium]
VFITHDLDEALKLGDRIAIMRDGRLVQVGTPEQILLRPADDYVASFVEDVDRAKVLQARDVMQRPEPLVRIGHSPRLALREMEQKGLSSVFVVGPGRRLEGIVTADEAVAAVQRGDESLHRILITDVATTSPNTPLRDLIGVAVRARFPIAVIDEQERLLGIIKRVSVLRGLAHDIDLPAPGRPDLAEQEAPAELDRRVRAKV